jgi:hypothetical protein
VAGGEGGTGAVQETAGEIELVRGNQVQEFDVGTAGCCTAGERFAELGGGGAHVPAYQDRLALELQDIHERGPHGFDDLGRYRLAHNAADVVRLEGSREVKSRCLFASHGLYLTWTVEMPVDEAHKPDAFPHSNCSCGQVSGAAGILNQWSITSTPQQLLSLPR